MQRQFWSGYCHGERLSAMAEIEAIIARHGYILNFQRFSDVSLGLLIGTTPAQMTDLYVELGAVMTMTGLQPVAPDSPGELIIFLNVTFTHGRGDLRIEVPRVPG